MALLLSQNRGFCHGALWISGDVEQDVALLQRWGRAACAEDQFGIRLPWSYIAFQLRRCRMELDVYAEGLGKES